MNYTIENSATSNSEETFSTFEEAKEYIKAHHDYYKEEWHKDRDEELDENYLADYFIQPNILFGRNGETITR